jgi:hypothetical protein
MVKVSQPALLGQWPPPRLHSTIGLLSSSRTPQELKETMRMKDSTYSDDLTTLCAPKGEYSNSLRAVGTYATIWQQVCRKHCKLPYFIYPTVKQWRIVSFRPSIGSRRQSIGSGESVSRRWRLCWLIFMSQIRLFIQLQTAGGRTSFSFKPWPRTVGLPKMFSNVMLGSSAKLLKFLETAIDQCFLSRAMICAFLLIRELFRSTAVTAQSRREHSIS